MATSLKKQHRTNLRYFNFKNANLDISRPRVSHVRLTHSLSCHHGKSSQERQLPIDHCQVQQLNHHNTKTVGLLLLFPPVRTWKEAT